MIRYLCSALLLSLMTAVLASTSLSTRAAAAAPAAAAAADTLMEDVGTIDIGEERRAMISELEAKLALDPDKDAKQVAIILQWLIELYEAAGRDRDVVMSYEKVLSYFPCYVAILNNYAQFMIDKMNNLVKARELAHDALLCGRIHDVSTSLIGNSHLLMGRVLSLQEDYAAAIDHLEQARFLYGEEVPEEVLRLLAADYYRADRHDEAARVLLELIGRARGSEPGDIDMLRRIRPHSARLRNEEIDDIVARAVKDEIQRERGMYEVLGAEVITIPMGDGIALEGSLYRGEGSGAVLFLPDIGDTRSGWNVFAQMVDVEGITALSVDLRGRGGSRTGSLPSPGDVSQPDISLLANDIAFILQYMKEELRVQEHEMVVVSEGRTCSATEEAFHRCGVTPAALYLSPIFDADGPELFNAVSFRKDRPILIMYSKEDVLVARSVRYFTSIKPLPRLETLQLEDAGHGREALSRKATALAEFDRWIRERLQPVRN